MQPGLRKLAPGTSQLTPLVRDSAHGREKRQALHDRPHTALLSTPGFDATPALHAIRQQAHMQGLDAPTFCDGEQVSLAFEQDFAVLDGSSGRVLWMAVCLPSHWAPEEKIGRHFAEIHAPVADNQMLLAASEQLVRLVTSGDRWERFVWTITPHTELAAHPAYLPPRDWPAEASADELAGLAFFRTERQTFIPVPHTQQAVFTIHVEVQPLLQAVDSPSKVKQLHDALISMSPAVLAYRRLTDARDRLVTWLAASAA